MSYQYMIFDLDNTLYSKDSGMLKYIDQKIENFIKERLNLSLEEVSHLRTEYYKKYGTTLGGMVTHYGTDPEEYIKYTYGIDVKQFLKPDERLKELLSRIKLKKVVFSNSPKEYVVEVLKVLGVEECFEKIYDIRFCKFLGKPSLSSYKMVLDDLRVSGEQCIFIDDVLVNVLGAEQLGMKTVWLNDQTASEVECCINEIYDLDQLFHDLTKNKVSA